MSPLVTAPSAPLRPRTAWGDCEPATKAIQRRRRYPTVPVGGEPLMNTTQFARTRRLRRPHRSRRVGDQFHASARSRASCDCRISCNRRHRPEARRFRRHGSGSPASIDQSRHRSCGWRRRCLRKRNADRTQEVPIAPRFELDRRGRRGDRPGTRTLVEPVPWPHARQSGRERETPTVGPDRSRDRCDRRRRRRVWC